MVQKPKSRSFEHVLYCPHECILGNMDGGFRSATGRFLNESEWSFRVPAIWVTILKMGYKVEVT